MGEARLAPHLAELWSQRLQPLWAAQRQRLPDSPPEEAWHAWAHIGPKGEAAAKSLGLKLGVPDEALTFQALPRIVARVEHGKGAKPRFPPNPTICVAPVVAPVRCYGVFACEDVPAKQPIGEYTGLLVEYEAWAEQIRQKKLKRGQKDNAPYIWDELYAMSVDFGTDAYVVDAYPAGNFARFCNSSCEPNCTVRTRVDQATRSVECTFYSTRPIRKHDQVCINYAWFNSVNEECMDDVTRSALRAYNADVPVLEELFIEAAARADGGEGSPSEVLSPVPLVEPDGFEAPRDPAHLRAVQVLLRSLDDKAAAPAALCPTIPECVFEGWRDKYARWLKAGEPPSTVTHHEKIPPALQRLYMHAGATFVGINCFCGADPTLNRRGPKKCAGIIGGDV